MSDGMHDTAPPEVRRLAARLGSDPGTTELAWQVQAAATRWAELVAAEDAADNLTSLEALDDAHARLARVMLDVHRHVEQITSGTIESVEHRADRLVAHIAIVAEAAYRRGFQQGHDAVHRGEQPAWDVESWRFLMPRDQSPEQLHGRVVPAVDRLRMQQPRIDELVRAAISGLAATRWPL